MAIIAGIVFKKKKMSANQIFVHQLWRPFRKKMFNQY